MLQSAIPEKIFPATLAKAYFNHTTNIIHGWHRQIHQPIMCVHSITTSRAATSIAFTTVWRSSTTITTAHLFPFTVLKIVFTKREL
jgi:hypothetical protein